MPDTSTAPAPSPLPGAPSPAPAPAPAPAPSPSPTGGGSTSPVANLTPGLENVLRALVKDANFRAQFLADRVLAITSAPIAITTADLNRLNKLTADQLDQLAKGFGDGSGLVRAGGTNTLAYAVLVALLIA